MQEQIIYPQIQPNILCTTLGSSVYKQWNKIVMPIIRDKKMDKS